MIIIKKKKNSVFIHLQKARETLVKNQWIRQYRIEEIEFALNLGEGKRIMVRLYRIIFL